MQQPETMRPPQEQPQGTPTMCYCPVCGEEHPMAYRAGWGPWGMRRMWHAGMWPMRMGFMGGMGLVSIAVGFIAGYLVGSNRER